MNNIKVYRLENTLGQIDMSLHKIIPQPSDIIKFSSGSVVLVLGWGESYLSLRSLEFKHIDRGWFFQLLEKWGLSSPQYKYEPIEITEKAYLIGRTQVENNT